jgi:aspartate 1-decarboxylase
MSFGLADAAQAEGWQPRVIVVDDNNAVIRQPGAGG